MKHTRNVSMFERIAGQAERLPCSPRILWPWALFSVTFLVEERKGRML